ncbi:MAG: hypothetical protein AAFX76_07535 [Planctomycetota bacterium]
MQNLNPRIKPGLPDVTDTRERRGREPLNNGLSVSACLAAGQLARRADIEPPAAEDAAAAAVNLGHLRASRFTTLTEILEGCARSEFGHDPWAWPTNDAVRSGLATFGFADAFRSIADTAFKEGFDSVPNPRNSPWLQRVELNNFRLGDIVGVESAGRLKRLARGQEAETAGGETKREVGRVMRFSRQMFIDEQDVTDDDVSSLMRQARQLGVDAVQTVRDLIVSTLLANRSLLVTGRALMNSTDGNSVSTALTSDSLADARQWMGEQTTGTTAESRPSHVRPVALVVPPALESAGRAAIQSQQILTNSNGNGVEADVGVNLEVWPELAAGYENTDPRDDQTKYVGSDSQWYLTGSPGPIGLLGRRESWLEPRTSAAPETVNRWGTGYGVTLDANAVALDYRAIYRGGAS